MGGGHGRGRADKRAVIVGEGRQERAPRAPTAQSDFLQFRTCNIGFADWHPLLPGAAPKVSTRVKTPAKRPSGLRALRAEGISRGPF